MIAVPVSLHIDQGHILLEIRDGCTFFCALGELLVAAEYPYLHFSAFIHEERSIGWAFSMVREEGDDVFFFGRIRF